MTGEEFKAHRYSWCYSNSCNICLHLTAVFSDRWFAENLPPATSEHRFGAWFGVGGLGLPKMRMGRKTRRGGWRKGEGEEVEQENQRRCDGTSIGTWRILQAHVSIARQKRSGYPPIQKDRSITTVYQIGGEINTMTVQKSSVEAFSTTIKMAASDASDLLIRLSRRY